MHTHILIRLFPFLNVDDGKVYAIGHYCCKKSFLMTCSCGESFNVRNGILVCWHCDYIWEIHCLPTSESINGSTCVSTEPPDETPPMAGSVH